MKKGVFILLVLMLCNAHNSSAQKYTEATLRSVLDSLSKNHPGLNNELQLNVSSLELSELINSVALENDLNISIDPSIKQLVSYNFFDAQVKDVLVYLYLEFELEYGFIGSIISVNKRLETAPIVIIPKRMDIKYNSANKFLSMDLKNDTLWQVVEELTKVSGKNFVIDSKIRNQKVNAYFLNRPYDQVLEMFAKSNELQLSKGENFYSIGKGDLMAVKGQGTETKKSPNYKSKIQTGDFRIEKNSIGTLDIFAHQVDLADIIQAAADETGVHYLFHSEIKGKTNMDVKDLRFEELVEMLFTGTEYSIKQSDGVYIVGQNKMEGLRVTELLRLENRTIESVKTAIPKELTTGLEVKEFEELNALILTGSKRLIDQLKTFVSSIDLIVPMVQIDVMLIYSERGSIVSTGIKAGVKDKPTTTSGTIFPGVDMELGSGTINNILNAISGFGVVNLGLVTENFYVSLNALESNNVINIQSTPKISTLNGHEATISIGETTYYQERQVNVQTSVTNQGVLQSTQWKSINADLTVTIKPFVSADEHVTLTISVEQDAFSGRNGETAPPNITTQTFESMVRVKNGELILLGGLEKKRKSDSGSGVPFLSRIPVLKWLFSSREKDKSKSKLHILVRPIVTY